MTVTRFVRISRQRVRSVFRGRAVDDEVDREMAFHLEQLALEYQQQGSSTQAARRQARRLFGNVTLLKEQTRDERRVSTLDDVRLDVIFGWRMIRARPAVALAAIVSLALAIGANAGALTAANAALRAPLPLPHGDRLVVVGAADAAAAGRPKLASISDFFAWREHATSFDDVEATLGGDRDFSSEAPDIPAERIQTRAVTPGWFRLIGAVPSMGRWITMDDGASSVTAPVVVIGHRLWQRRYGGDPSVVGRVVRVNGVSTTIVGVMPADFLYQDRRTEAWVPLGLAPAAPARDAKWLQVIARLRPGITIDAAARELNAGPSSGAASAGTRTAVASFREMLYGWSRAPLLGIAAATFLLLLTTCANLSVVSLAQCEARRREIGMRLALGAGHRRVVRQWLTESVMLISAAALPAVGVTWWMLRVVGGVLSAPIGWAALRPVTMSGTAVFAVIAISAAVALALTMAPAWFIGRLHPWNTVRSGGRTSPANRRRTGQAMLLTAQIASSCALMFVGSLLGQTYWRAAHRDLNIDTRNLSTFELRAPVPEPAAVFARTLDRLRALPGVIAAAGISDAPVNTLIVPDVTVAVRSDPAPGSPVATLTVKSFIVTPGIFATLRATLGAGREIDERDTSTAPWVVVVNERAAEMLNLRAGSDGYLTIQGHDGERPRAIVGVVRNIPLARREVGTKPIIYTSYVQQVPTPLGPIGDQTRHMQFIVRANGDPTAIGRLAQQAAATINPDRPLVPGGPPGPVGILLFEFRNYAVVILALGAMTGLLAAVGFSGTLARRIDEATAEIGIRRALGTSGLSLVAVLCRTHALIVLAGVSVGLGTGIAIGQMVRPQLWRVDPADPMTIVTTCAVAAGVVSMACLGPMRRALSIEPAIALRHD